MKNLSFKPEDFLAKLPMAYYSDDLDMALAEDIWNFEANAIPEDGNYMLCLKFKGDISFIYLSVFNGDFAEIKLSDGHCELAVAIVQQRLTFDIKTPGIAAFHLEKVMLIDPANKEKDVEEFKLYKRETKLENCNLLENWESSYRQIMSEDFNWNELAEMRNEIVNWMASRQVLDKEDPHCGAIYSQEDKYCFRDAIFAACCFMREYLRTHKTEWKDRACAARDYCYKGQYRNSGNPGKDGAWAAMGIIDDSEGKNFRRITDEWAQASGVDTFIIGIMSGELFKMGMEFSEEHLKQLSEAVEWNSRNKVAYGWFSHHEGMTLNCVNVNSLASSMLYSIHMIFKEATGKGLDDGILKEADASFKNVLECQEAIGVYPYRKADIKRGGKYWLNNFPDNGIGLQAVMRMLKNPYSPLSFENLSSHMRRTALWYLLCSRWEDGNLILEYRDDEEFLQGLAFGNFTWCRITMLDIISQLADSIGNKDFWTQFCRCHIRTIREKLWNDNNPEKAPVKESVVPIKVVSWVQQAEWAAFVFDNLLERCGTESSE